MKEGFAFWRYPSRAVYWGMQVGVPVGINLMLKLLSHNQVLQA